MVKRKISIHDIARQLEVSAATVSYVLNGKAAEKRISQAMAQKVLQHVAESGYRPNRVAKSLRTGKSKIIGMLVEDIADPFFSSISRIIEKYAHRHDYKILHASTENEAVITRDLLRVFRDTQVDGFIIAPPPGIEKDIAALMNDDLPIVLFDRFFPDLDTYNVIVDNLGGAHEAVDHFIANGYNHIGLVTLNSTQTQMHDRLLGYSNAMVQQGLTPAVLKIPYEMEREKLVVEKIAGFLQSNPALDAILFATNYLAISGLEAIHQCGLQIPEDIAVVGFDDNTHFSLFSPSISAVAQPVEEMSKTVIEALINCLSGTEKVLGKETIVLPTSLIVRQSSRQVARNTITV